MCALPLKNKRCGLFHDHLIPNVASDMFQHAFPLCDSSSYCCYISRIKKWCQKLKAQRAEYYISTIASALLHHSSQSLHQHFSSLALLQHAVASTALFYINCSTPQHQLHFSAKVLDIMPRKPASTWRKNYESSPRV